MKFLKSYKELFDFLLGRWKYFLLVIVALLIQYVLFPRSFDSFNSTHSNYYQLFYCFTVFYSFDFGFQRNLVRTGEKFVQSYLVYTFIGYLLIFYLINFTFFHTLILALISTISHVLNYYKYATEVADKPNKSITIRILHIFILYVAFCFSSNLNMFGFIYGILHFSVILYYLRDLHTSINFTTFSISRSQLFFLVVNVIYFFGNVLDKFFLSGTVLSNKDFVVLNESLSYSLSAVNIMIPIVAFNKSLTPINKGNFFKTFLPITILIFCIIYVVMAYLFDHKIIFNIYYFIYACAILLNASNSFMMLVPKETGYFNYFVASVSPTLLYFIFVIVLGNVSLTFFLTLQIIKLLLEFTLRNLFLKDYETKS